MEIASNIVALSLTIKYYQILENLCRHIAIKNVFQVKLYLETKIFVEIGTWANTLIFF